MNPKTFELSKNLGKKLAIVFLIVIILLEMGNEIWAKDKNDMSNYMFSTKQNSLAAFGQCDATDEFMYFSYWGKTSRVEVYDSNACFLYSIVFDDVENGRMYIRCEQDNLILKLRNDNVYIFCGREMLAFLTEEEADSRGYTNDWFQNMESRLKIEGNSIYLMDTEGQLQNTVSKPAAIIESSSSLDSEQLVNRGVFSICIILFLLIIYWLCSLMKSRGIFLGLKD